MVVHFATGEVPPELNPVPGFIPSQEVVLAVNLANEFQLTGCSSTMLVVKVCVL